MHARLCRFFVCLVALLQRNVDAAAKAFGEARNLTKDKDERGYLSAAIVELNKAHNVMKGTY